MGPVPSASAVAVKERRLCSQEARETKDVNPVFTQCERCFEESKHVEIREANFKQGS